MLRLDAAFGQKIADISIILHVFMSNQVRAMSALLVLLLSLRLSSFRRRQNDFFKIFLLVITEKRLQIPRKPKFKTFVGLSGE